MDRHLRRDLRFYKNKISCKVALVKDDLSVEIWRSHHVNQTDVTGQKLTYSLSKCVSLSDSHSNEDVEQQSVTICESYPLSITSSDCFSMLNSSTTHSNANRSEEPSSSTHFGSSSGQ